MSLREKAKAKALKWLLEDFWEGQVKGVESWEDMEAISGLDGVHLEEMLDIALEDAEKEITFKLSYAMLQVAKCKQTQKELKQKLQQIIDRHTPSPNNQGTSHQNGWLDGVSFALRKFEELLRDE